MLVENYNRCKSSKKFLDNKVVQYLIYFFINLYLYIVKLTTRLEYRANFEGNYKDYFNSNKPSIVINFHNQLILAYLFLHPIGKRFCTLSSPHRDSMIFAKLSKKAGVKVIIGTSNKNPVSAAKQIIQNLKSGRNVLITPDGPKGPKYNINSNLIGISFLSKAPIIPMHLSISKYKQLNNWDNLIIPLPFGKLLVNIGNPIQSGQIKDNKEFAKILHSLMLKT